MGLAITTPRSIAGDVADKAFEGAGHPSFVFHDAHVQCDEVFTQDGFPLFVNEFEDVGCANQLVVFVTEGWLEVRDGAPSAAAVGADKEVFIAVGFYNRGQRADDAIPDLLDGFLFRTLPQVFAFGR